MAKLIIHQEKVTDNQELVKICPFGAMEEKDGKLSINAACKMCRLCVKKGPEGAVEYVEDTARPSVNKEEWKGTNLIFVEKYFRTIGRDKYELITLGNWVNCNTLDDFNQIQEY